ncbi:DUF2271 domain-containing protein [uncultured Sphaerochaeta sp.]|uniref:DUF2271 domain-containing protein n=1 Tax=uncultured Sphaerochaeta sp. TaxID=886478 RepID=UPI002A0A1BA7|nr:DUF2271 domain-containing protein [uncultured Sphaerochaeta sp.]
MKKKSLVLVVLIICVVLVGGYCKGTEDPEVSMTNASDGTRFVLELTPGKSYEAKQGWFIFAYTVYPQVAVWLENPNGDYLETIYVTAKGEKENWRSAPKNGRPEALPVWNHVKDQKAEAVSAATSKGETLSDSNLSQKLPNGTYVVKLETNRSYDWNEAYPESKVGVVGQPSVVYKAVITIGDVPFESVFKPYGTGSIDGSNGNVKEGLDGLDTALTLFSSLKISYIPSK